MTSPAGFDWADHAVNFGFTVDEAIGLLGGHSAGGLPDTPPPARRSCDCPHCTSEGWYAQSPLCLMWRVECWLCGGRREWFDPATRLCQCQDCQDRWAEQVTFFHEVLRDPRAAAQVLRERARSPS